MMAAPRCSPGPDTAQPLWGRPSILHTDSQRPRAHRTSCMVAGSGCTVSVPSAATSPPGAELGCGGSAWAASGGQESVVDAAAAGDAASCGGGGGRDLALCCAAATLRPATECGRVAKRRSCASRCCCEPQLRHGDCSETESGDGRSRCVAGEVAAEECNGGVGFDSPPDQASARGTVPASQAWYAGGSVRAVPDSARKARPPEACQMLRAEDADPLRLRSAQTADRRALCMTTMICGGTLRVADESF